MSFSGTLHPLKLLPPINIPGAKLITESAYLLCTVLSGYAAASAAILCLILLGKNLSKRSEVLFSMVLPRSPYARQNATPQNPAPPMKLPADVQSGRALFTEQVMCGNHLFLTVPYKRFDWQTGVQT